MMNNRLKEVRIKSGLSQEEFGKKIGIESRSHISALEKGNRNITDRIINDVCREFRIRKEWFLTGKGDMEDDIDLSFSEICLKIGISDEKAKRAIIDYWHLTPEDKTLFWNFVERFIN